MSYILGISALYHDSAAALIKDGEIVAAVQEERFSRKKHDQSFPSNSIRFCLDFESISLDELDSIVFYDKPFLKFERLLETYLAYAPKGLRSFIKAMPIWLREKLFLKNLLTKELKKISKSFDAETLRFSEHHFSHAASAFYSSPFKDAVVLTLDGVGEWTTSSVAIGSTNKLNIIKEIHFPHSLGLLYSAFTFYLGFRVNSGEYKVMGLAPYGSPKYEKIIFDHLIDLKTDGSFRLNMSYFNYPVGLTMVNDKFVKLFGNPIRKPDTDNLEQFHMDIAASVQSAVEKIVLKIIESLSMETKVSNLCLAGGVALNCVANGKIHRSGFFKKVWIQPASGDAGGALGAAQGYWFSELNRPRKINNLDSMKGSYLGPSYNDKDIQKRLNGTGAIFQNLSQNEMIKFTADKLANGAAIGWFQGRMEFGPRSLGSRSILADSRSSHMQRNLNLKVKYRESFRPFAPAILREDVNDWFELDDESPYMLLVDSIKKSIRVEMSDSENELFGIDKLNVKRSKIPAVTHVDYSARIQTVHRETNKVFYSLLKEFKELTNCPILVNTSFNVRGEPIVCSPEDAFRCFMGTELDYLVIGNIVLDKKQQDKNLLISYKDKFKLD